jgi:hypothetical protein
MRKQTSWSLTLRVLSDRHGQDETEAEKLGGQRIGACSNANHIAAPEGAKTVKQGEMKTRAAHQLSVPQPPYPGVAGRMSGAAGIGIWGDTATVTLTFGDTFGLASVSDDGP